MSNQIVSVTFNCGCVVRPPYPDRNSWCRIGWALVERLRYDRVRAGDEHAHYLKLTEAAASMHLMELVEGS